MLILTQITAVMVATCINESMSVLNCSALYLYYMYFQVILHPCLLDKF